MEFCPFCGRTINQMDAGTVNVDGGGLYQLACFRRFRAGLCAHCGEPAPGMVSHKKCRMDWKYADGGPER